MSVIFGGIALCGAAFGEDILETMRSAMAPLVPGLRAAETFGPCGLGLGILPVLPEDAHETGPQRAGEGRFALVAEGRVDNRDDLRRALGLTTEETARWPDSRWLLAAYTAWGEAAMDRVVGEYCAALWDAAERRLTLLRDPAGKHHTLFYTIQRDRLLFATHIQALHAVPGVERRQDLDKFADFLILNHADHYSTQYVGINRLPPAHALSVTPGGVERGGARRIWEFSPGETVRLNSDDAYIEAFDAIFNEAVRARLRSIKPVAAMMSGGVDSSAVAVRALRSGLDRLRTYTSVPQPGYDIALPNSRYADERPYVEEIAALNPGLDPRFVHYDGLSPDDGDGDHFDIHGAPFRNACNRVWVEGILRDAAAEGYGVILNGQAGNMTLSWHGWEAIPDWLRAGRLLSALRGLRGRARHDRTTLRRQIRQELVNALPPALVERLRVALRGPEDVVRPHMMINRRFAEERGVFARAAAQGFDPLYRAGKRGGQIYRRSVLFGSGEYGGDIAAGWRAAHGIEMRDPTGDRRLIDFCLSIPDDQYLRNGEPRWLVKRAFRGQLPDSVLWNTRRGQQDPGWFLRIKGKQAEYRAEIERMRNSSRVSEILDLDRMAALVENWPDETESNTRAVVTQYRAGLLRGLHAARYVRWLNRENW